jgi:hypothetical protein
MKRLLYIIIGILSLSVNAQDRALLIGISEYQKGTYWEKIHSYNDIALLQQVLPNTCKVTTLCDAEATYQGIIQTISQFIQDTRYGEQVLLHFSGHGQQMLTDDPNEPDLLDEALIPYDAPRTSTSTYRGERHLVDNQLDSLTTLLRAKAGGDGLVVVSIDACHSGGTHRGKCLSRGTRNFFGRNTISPDSARNIDLHLTKNVEQPTLSKSNNTADLVYLSACLPYEVIYEVKENGEFYGPLTFAISKAYASHSFLSIKEWLHAIEEYMKKEVQREPYIIDTLD